MHFIYILNIVFFNKKNNKYVWQKILRSNSFMHENSNNFVRYKHLKNIYDKKYFKDLISFDFKIYSDIYFLIFK